MLNNKGFILIESIISAMIIITLMITCISITTLLTQERKVLKDRRTFSTLLHDELQDKIWLKRDFPQSYHKSINSRDVTLNFSLEEDYVKGCVIWENARKTEEIFCLYGIPKE